MTVKALKVRIYPNESQLVQLNKNFGCSRFIYNTLLSEHIEIYERYKDDKEKLHSYKYKTEKELKSEFDWLKEADSISLQQTRMNLGVAYENFFNRCKNPKIPKDQKGYPKFKKKFGKNSYRTVSVNGNLEIDFEHKKIKAPKLGWISFRDQRVIEDISIRSITFSRTPSLKYYASILYEDNSIIPNQIDINDNSALKIRGLDMSLTDFFVDDEGNSPQFDKNYRKAESKIAELQRKIDNTKNKSLKNKLRLRLNRIHEKIANKRRDFNEKLSSTLIKENDVIAIETLSLKDIARYKKLEERERTGDFNNHGKSVGDLGWGYFVNRLKTKAKEHGKLIIEADKWFASTKTCNVCGYVNKDMDITVRKWECPICGTVHNRDHNAALNLKNVALDRIINFTEGTSGRAEHSKTYYCSESQPSSVVA